MQLNRKLLAENSIPAFIQKPPDYIFNLPEKIIQFGTGVLLRGLPDYYVDKANKHHCFNGRIVIIKSTGDDVHEFAVQDNLFTHCLKGIGNGNADEAYMINAAVSRVLSAAVHWKKILACAQSADLKVVISNTTEVGIQLKTDDDIYAEPPVSFPGKLLAFLYHRFVYFKGSKESGVVIIPTELIEDNAATLKQILIQLASIHQLNNAFVKWLTTANDFCNSLVDRIVPGALTAEEQKKFETKAGYTDELMIMSEPYSLWAIETVNPKTIETLSFSKADCNIVIAPQIHKYRELKLRLLNATHTICCGLAHLSGFSYVCDAMQDETFKGFVTQLMLKEIIPCVIGDYITEEEATAFAYKVTERFSNPFIQHKWTSIAVQYTAKFRLRVIPLISKYAESKNEVPPRIMAGFAAYIIYMKPARKSNEYYTGTSNNTNYRIEDDKADWYFEMWKNTPFNNIAETVICAKELWENNLAGIKDVGNILQSYLNQMQDKTPEQVMEMINQSSYTRSIHSS